MKPIRTRTDLIALAAQHAPSKACVRAIAEDRAQVLGGFNPVEGLPALIVRVQSRHGREWIVAVLIDEPNRRHKIRYLDAVPWLVWDGKSTGKRPLIDGDVPLEVAYERMKARRRGSRATDTPAAQADQAE